MRIVRRLPAGMQTIRFRLTATYSLILFAVTTAVLGAVYAVVSRSVDAAPLDPITVSKVERVGRWLMLRPDQQFQAADLASVQRAVNHQTLQVLRDASVVALAGLLVLSLLIGWWLAGRALRPVRRVTATANEIGATDLSRRIALDGPHDEIHALAGTIDAMLARLDDAFTSQRRMIDDASHELRHPLAVIHTTLDAVLSRDDVTPEERRQATIVTARATARMSGLVEDVLASARRAAPAFVETDVDLSAVVADVAGDRTLVAGEAGVALVAALTPATTVIGDADALRRALDNVVANAVRVAPAGSTVTVANGRERGWAWVAVRDQGPGIPDDDQERVFDRFWRSPGSGRTGLGLAIVRQIVESHGGQVTLHSRVGHGSTFVLWLPERPGTGAQRAATAPAGDPLRLQAADF